MAEFPIRVPRVSTAAFEATLVSVLVENGETVDQDAPLFVIETEKIETEVPAAASGIVHWSGSLGEVYDVGAEIGVIETSTGG
jgi:pyruvate/2-oxoglutarate dehydrogenase complex dihydrolipoamide acyltransferase (E2) component